MSVGVNLNPNRACNWACVYCQVEGLVRGVAPPIDLDLLARELDGFLGQVAESAWIEAHAPAGAQQLTDVAFSGDGEPTTAAEFPEIVARVAAVIASRGLDLPLILITNGSQLHRPAVQEGVARLARARGTVWFKLDRATREGRRAVNGVDVPDARVEDNLRTCAALAPTRVQTCCFAVDGAPPPEAEVEAWLGLLARLAADRVPLVDVMLYGLARPSHQPAAGRLSALPAEWLEALAVRVRALGYPATVHP